MSRPVPIEREVLCYLKGLGFGHIHVAYERIAEHPAAGTGLKPNLGIGSLVLRVHRIALIRLAIRYKRVVGDPLLPSNTGALRNISGCSTLSKVALMNKMLDQYRGQIDKGVPSREFNERALRLRQVCQMTGLGRSMIYQLEAESRFPQRIKLSERAVAWLESEVQAWLDTRIEESRTENPVPKRRSLA
jgi:predicted DNA-binding transcriptional regulator AlpA